MTHTLKTLLALPLDELNKLVVENANIPERIWKDYGGNIHPLPHRDYCSSLDAMKPLEDGMTTQDEKVAFLNALRKVVGTEKLKNESETPVVSDFDLLTATAHHRAVAWVATKLKL